MSSPNALLKQIHHLRRHLVELEEKIAEAPRLLKARQNVQSKQQSSVDKNQDEIKHLKVQIHEKETSIKAQQQHIEKLEKSDISSKKEWDALRAEIAHARDAIRKFEDEILESMGKIEEKTRALPEAEKQAAQARAEASRFEQEQTANLARYAEERTRTQAELVEVEKTLPPEILPLFLRLVKAKGDDAFAAVVGKSCTACYTELTTQHHHDLGRGQFMVCKNCDRMLYVG